jgi:hypothetical protein
MRKSSLYILLAFASGLSGQDTGRPISHDELISRYESYNGKRIVIGGQVLSSPESTVMFLRDSSPPSNQPEGMLITLSERVSKKPGPTEKRFLKTLKKTGRAEIIASGRFEGSQGRIWGHLACCRFRFEIDHVISVK